MSKLSPTDYWKARAVTAEDKVLVLREWRGRAMKAEKQVLRWQNGGFKHHVLADIAASLQELVTEVHVLNEKLANKEVKPETQ